VGPEIVPVASRSPVLRLHPLIVCCATISFTVQYIDENLDLQTVEDTEASAGWSDTSTPMSKLGFGSGSWRYDASSTSGFRTGAEVLNGARASRVMIHGEILVPKDFPFIGPNGTISIP
jgi:hypothetical protein